MQYDDRVQLPVDEQFPRREHLVFALTVSFFSALAGFILSYTLFFEPATTESVNRVDRKTAEGYRQRIKRAKRQNNQAPARSGSYTYLGYVAPQTPTRVRPKRPIAVEPSPTRSPEEKPSPSPSSSPSTKAKLKPLVKPRVAVRPPPRPQPTGLGARLVYPEVTNRREPLTPEHYWPELSEAVIKLASLDGSYTTGVVVSRDGLAITRASGLSPAKLSRVWISGRLTEASLVTRDPQLDLALLRLAGGGPFPSLTLSPQGPSRGDRLLYHNGDDRERKSFLVGETTRPLGPGFFHFRGYCPPGASGGPLFNDRGELTGVLLGHLQGFPGYSYNLASDSAGLARLIRQGNPVEAVAPPLENRCIESLLEAVPRITDRERPRRSNARLIPGQSLGNYALGMTEAQLEKELGRSERSALFSGLVKLHFPSHKLTFTLAGDRAVAIETTYSFYATESGLCVGTTLDRPRRNREMAYRIEAETRTGELLMMPGLEVSLDRQGKVSKFTLVPTL